MPYKETSLHSSAGHSRLSRNFARVLDRHLDGSGNEG
jgi:hypothetical protein